MDAKESSAEPWILNIYQFTNGMVAVTDGSEQIPELQGHYNEAIPKVIKWLDSKVKMGAQPGGRTEGEGQPDDGEAETGGSKSKAEGAHRPPALATTPRVPCVCHIPSAEPGDWYCRRCGGDLIPLCADIDCEVKEKNIPGECLHVVYYCGKPLDRVYMARSKQRRVQPAQQPRFTDGPYEGQEICPATGRPHEFKGGARGKCIRCGQPRGGRRSVSDKSVNEVIVGIIARLDRHEARLAALEQQAAPPEALIRQLVERCRECPYMLKELDAAPPAQQPRWRPKCIHTVQVYTYETCGTCPFRMECQQPRGGEGPAQRPDWIHGQTVEEWDEQHKAKELEKPTWPPEWKGEVEPTTLDALGLWQEAANEWHKYAEELERVRDKLIEYLTHYVTELAIRDAKELTKGLP